VRQGRSPRNQRLLAGALVVGVAYALWVASTTPFTWQANVAVAAALVVAAGAAVRWWPKRTVTIRLVDRVKYPYVPWVVLLAILVGWEVYCYVAPGSRAQHPTFSSMADAVDRHEGLKTLVVLAWLSLGWMIVRRGSGSAASR
jgi:hypothetical protein